MPVLEQWDSKQSEDWTTSADLPSPSPLATADPFFARAEQYVRYSRGRKHGISSELLEAAPIVLYADSMLPAWDRQSRYILAAKALLNQGPESRDLRLLWAFDVLEEARLLTQSQLIDYFRNGSFSFPADLEDNLHPFSREWYAYRVLSHLALAGEHLRAADPGIRWLAMDAAMRAEGAFRDYAFKAIHEPAALAGYATQAGGRKGGVASKRKRRGKWEQDLPKWIEYARKHPAKTYEGTAKKVAAHFGAPFNTVRKYLPRESR